MRDIAYSICCAAAYAGCAYCAVGNSSFAAVFLFIVGCVSAGSVNEDDK